MVKSKTYRLFKYTGILRKSYMFFKELLTYSYLRLSTGLADAALNVWKATVSRAIVKAAVPERMKIQTLKWVR